LDTGNQDLISACQRGDRNAYHELFQSYKDRAYSIALRFSGDPATAMDITQETFLKLLSHMGDFRGESKFDTWLYRMVANCCLDHQRRRARWVPFLESMLEVWTAPRENALDHLMEAEFAGEVQSSVAKLPPDQRMVVVLRYTEVLSYDEIAEVLGCSPGTVASRLNRAHKTLERRLRHLKGTCGNTNKARGNSNKKDVS
jgi:RNA polymerase sigma-70 factor (ECF subfamily)